MVLEQNVRIDRAQIADFCRRNHIRKLSIFGSALTDRFRPDSDIDVLVEFEPGKTPGWDFFQIERDLSDLLGRKVEMGTPDSLSKYIREKVISQAQIIYGGV
jgi:predicted nucleotidyltransferase